MRRARRQLLRARRGGTGDALGWWSLGLGGALIPLFALAGSAASGGLGLSLLFVAVGVGAAAIVLGILALVRAKETPQVAGSRAPAIIGMILGWTGAGLALTALALAALLNAIFGG